MYEQVGAGTRLECQRGNAGLGDITLCHRNLTAGLGLQTTARTMNSLSCAASHGVFISLMDKVTNQPDYKLSRGER